MSAGMEFHTIISCLFGTMNEVKWCELNNVIHTNLFDSSTDVMYDMTPDQLQQSQGVDAAQDYMVKCGGEGGAG